MLATSCGGAIRVAPYWCAPRAGPGPGDTAAMTDEPLIIHGPQVAAVPLVLDSPHSGTGMPADFGAALPVADLRDGEDCFIDELYLPASALGIPLLAAQFSRTYLDPNRHVGDIDLDLLDAPWPDLYQPRSLSDLGRR